MYLSKSPICMRAIAAACRLASTLSTFRHCSTAVRPIPFRLIPRSALTVTLRSPHSQDPVGGGSMSKAAPPAAERKMPPHPEAVDSPFAKTAWFCLDRDAAPRRQLLYVVMHPYFDTAVLTLILLNCVSMTVRATARTHTSHARATERPFGSARRCLPTRCSSRCSTVPTPTRPRLGPRTSGTLASI